MQLFKEKENKSSILSAVKPNEPILKTGYETKTTLQTELKQKSMIKVYIEGNKYYVDHGAAHALGLINTRAIMLDGPKLIEISSDIHNKLKTNDSMEIEYINNTKDTKNTNDTKRQILRVYMDDSNCCIDNSAAYALGLISVDDFNNSESEHYYIPKELLDNLSTKFDIELNPLKVENEASDKKL